MIINNAKATSHKCDQTSKSFPLDSARAPRIITHIPNHQGKDMASGQSKPQGRTPHNTNHIPQSKNTQVRSTRLFMPLCWHKSTPCLLQWRNMTRRTVDSPPVISFHAELLRYEFQTALPILNSWKSSSSNEKDFYGTVVRTVSPIKNIKLLRLIHCLFRGNMQRVPYRP
jgi:hypothetical protein